MLPPPLSGLQILWQTLVVVPLISIALIGTPADKNLMKTITGKRGNVNVVKDMVLPYVVQFFPTFCLNSLFISICVFPCLLYSFCNQIVAPPHKCKYFFGAVTANLTSPWNGWYGEFKGGFFFVQDLILFYVTLSFLVLSLSFVHRSNLVWQRLPTRNKPWCLCVFVTILLQLLFTICSLYHWTEERLSVDRVRLYFHNIPYELTLGSMMWLPILVGISELSKRRVVRRNLRFQKRERLKFDTKLGMNSPV